MDTPGRKQRAITSDKVDPTKPASIVIDKFGGLTRFCEITGYATSTAHGWTVSGYIPPHRRGASTHAFILAKAKQNGVKLDPADFVDKPANDAASAPALANGQ